MYILLSIVRVKMVYSPYKLQRILYYYFQGTNDFPALARGGLQVLRAIHVGIAKFLKSIKNEEASVEDQDQGAHHSTAYVAV